MAKKRIIKANDGSFRDFHKVLRQMDDGILDELNNSMRGAPAQLFYDQYCLTHIDRFGEEFVIP